jgi:hypothetical protein
MAVTTEVAPNIYRVSMFWPMGAGLGKPYLYMSTGFERSHP